MRKNIRWWALGALVLSGLVIGFDLTILNVALPTLARDLGADTGEQQWIVDAFLIAYAGAMLPAGLLGDRFGRKRMLLLGLGVFAAGSLIGALVDTTGPVIAARALMGLGAAVVFPLLLAVVPVLFPDDRERSRAVALISVGFALGMPFGPLIGGALLDHFWWGSVFLLNLPMLAVAILAVVLLLPESREADAPPLNLLGCLLVVAGLTAVVLGVIEGPRQGWTAPGVLGSFAAGAVLLAALVLLERRAAHPVVQVSLLRDRGFGWGTAAGTVISFVMTGVLFVVPMYLQGVLGLDAFGTGLRLMPMMGGLLLAGASCGVLVPRLGARWVIGFGLAVAAFGTLLGARTEVGDGYSPTAVWLAVLGIGVGYAMIPSLEAALGALDRERTGAGSGLYQTLRQVGGALGVALLGSLLASRFADRLDTGGLPPGTAATARESVIAADRVAERLDRPELAASGATAFVDGMAAALAVCAGAALITMVLVLAFVPGGIGLTARQPAADADPGGTVPAGTDSTVLAETDAGQRQSSP